MSLTMSFNPKQPYLLGAGGLFNIDHPFMWGVSFNRLICHVYYDVNLKFL